MMQVPSSNHSTGTSRRSNTSHRKSTLATLFEDFIDKACCAAAGYAAGDEVDDNSIAYESENVSSATNNPRAATSPRDDSSIMWEAPDESIQWQQSKKQPREYRQDERRTPTKGMTTTRHHHHHHVMPQSPGSEATATTVLTGSTNSSRGLSPRVSAPPSKSSQVRAHSTGNIRHPEDEWQQQRLQDERSIRKQRNKSKKHHTPREVLIPTDWTHEHGLRRIQSDTYKLPFQTVPTEHGVYHRSNN